ncbi:hypothetical protein PMZ80_009847 [Knufia obscura]|uniref:Casein kinase II beta 2 subunit n=2 Tax=Knufia TaxID=430999 RepID=A0AAN8IQE0_9EURO|nr:hypothetical protein PMZ80_009847 [Knufia obscura]KAK5955942.1 hypothetical protein OHC33_002515 [Knufia fluminis]
MASSGGHLLVAKTMRLIKFGVDKARNAVRERLGQVGQVEARTEHVYARIQNKPVSRLQAIKQSQSRQYSTHRVVNNAVRWFTTEAPHATKPLRSSYPTSRTRSAVSNLTSRTPFASTLRPNLTGGTLSRSAGGYTTGTGRVGGARYFSHGPAQPAEVIQNVSQAVRAFWLQGHKARYDGYNHKTGHKRFRAVSPTQDQARNAFDLCHAQSAGSFVDFKINPTITAVGPLSTIPRSDSYNSHCFASEHSAPTTSTIADEKVMTTLSVDFARALKDLAAIMNDLKHLATLGSLPLVLVDPTTLRVRFPGCDRDTVEALCTELGIRRGIVGQDEDFETQHGADMALRFPFAPSKTASEADLCEIYDGWRPAKRTRREDVEWHGMLSAQQSEHSLENFSHDFETVSPGLQAHAQGQEVFGMMTKDGDIIENPWLGSRPVSAQMSDYSSLHPSEEGPVHFQPDYRQYSGKRSHQNMSQAEYEGIEGIYRFIEHCDRAKR